MGNILCKKGHLASPQEEEEKFLDEGVAVGKDQGGKQVMVLYDNGIVL